MQKIRANKNFEAQFEIHHKNQLELSKKSIHSETLYNGYLPLYSGFSFKVNT